MKKTVALFIFYFGLSIPIFCQNLVPNPSFEEIDSIPCSWTNSTQGEFNILFSDWFQPTRGTTDVFTTYVDSSCYASCYSTHENAKGVQMPRTGNVMTSIVTFGKGCAFNTYREYLSVKLLEKLDSGRTYYAEMYVSHGDYVGMVTNNIGMLFTEDSIAKHNYYDCGYLDQIPQVSEDKVITEEDDWERVSGFFTPKNEAEYLVIGNMHPNSETTFELVRHFFDDRATLSGTYFVDDVLVRPCLMVTPDTLICKGNSIDLVARGNPIYGWADEQKPDEILETDSIYSVSPESTTTYLVYGECDTLSVKVTIPESLNDTTLCDGDSINFFLNYEKEEDQWVGDSLLTLSDQGIYTIDRQYPGCIQTDIISLQYKPNPVLYLGEDSLICNVDTITLDVTEQNATYKWNDRSEDPLRIITHPGYYAVEGWLDGCYSKNSINISPEICDTELLMPNVFTPNHDQVNDRFIPIDINGIAEMKLTIFNRYGVEVFNSTNFDQSWDGTFNGDPVPTGEYYYLLNYRDKNDNTSTAKGSISVIR